MPVENCHSSCSIWSQSLAVMEMGRNDRKRGRISGLGGAILILSAAAFSMGATPSPGIVFFSEDFEAGLTERWVEQGFPSIARRNVFSVAAEPDGNHYLKVESARSYSAKGIHIIFSPEQCPHLSWRWKVSKVIVAADLSRKEGDDAAAKLYFVFAGPSVWKPFDTRILVYLWDNRAPVDAIYPNVWLPEKERMVILESGATKVGQWVSEQVNLLEDFKRAFPGEDPGIVQGVAFLADTDNTQSQVSAGFDDLLIRCNVADAGGPRT